MKWSLKKSTSTAYSLASKESDMNRPDGSSHMARMRVKIQRFCARLGSRRFLRGRTHNFQKMGNGALQGIRQRLPWRYWQGKQDFTKTNLSGKRRSPRRFPSIRISDTTRSCTGKRGKVLS